MLKMTFCLHRQPHLTREAFLKYWLEDHGPLVAKHAKTLGIIRYVQNHALTSKVNVAMQATRGGLNEMYDGIAEAYFESWESFFAASDNEGAAEASAILIEDERTFIDFSRSPLWFNEEHVILDET